MKMPEGLLIIGAILLPFTFRLSSFDIHVGDTYYVVSSTLSNITFSLILIVQFVLHLVLRKRNRRSVSIAWIHVSLTLLTVAIFVYFSYLNNAAIQDADNFNRIESFLQPHASVPIWSLIVFALLQVLFIIYFVSRMISSDRR
jgi:hypothetical protein